MRDPNAVIYLVPGVGMLSFAKDKATARIAGGILRQRDQRHARRLERQPLCRPRRAGGVRHRILAARRGQAPAHAEAEVARRPGRPRHRRRGRHRPGDRRSGCWAKAPASCSPTSTGRASTRRVADFRKAFGKDAVAGALADVTDEAAVEAAFRDAVVAYGGVDIVVANAGIASAAPFEDTSLELWNRNIDILATGYFLVAREAFRLMKDQGLGGSIVFIASKNALAASPGASAYCTAKAAEVHLARCLALEGAPHRHPRQHRQSRRGAARLEDLAGRMARAARRLQQGRRGRARGGLPPALAAEALASIPEDIAEAVYFFASDLSAKSDRQHPQRRRRQRGELHAVDHAHVIARAAKPSRRGRRWIVRWRSATTRKGGTHVLSHSRRADRRGERQARGGAGRGLRGARPRSSSARGIDIDAITAKVAAFAVAVPTWGVGTGGTRFARFPGPGEPRNIFDKLEDCATIQQLTRATPTCSPHFPWDKVSDYRELAERAKALGLGFDAINSNTFQDQPGQKLSYKFGSLTHSDEGGARSGGRAQHRMHRDRREARLEGADGLDRRRLEFPGPVESEPRLRLLSRIAERDLCAPAGRLAGVPRAQALRAGLLFDGHLGLGHRA